MCSCQGQIYIDVPFDQALPEYRKLAGFLENQDGTMRLVRRTILLCEAGGRDGERAPRRARILGKVGGDILMFQWRTVRRTETTGWSLP